MGSWNWSPGLRDKQCALSTPEKINGPSNTSTIGCNFAFAGVRSGVTHFNALSQEVGRYATLQAGPWRQCIGVVYAFGAGPSSGSPNRPRLYHEQPSSK